MKTVAVISVKGGTGKTLTAINLAHHLQKITNSNVGLIDSDIDSSMFAEFVKTDGSIDLTEDKKFKLYNWGGVKVWSMSLLTDKDRPISMTGDRYAQILNDVVNFSDWGKLDYMVVDLPAGSTDSFRAMVYVFAESLVGNVIIIQPAFEDNAKRVIKLHKVNEVPILGLVENMAYLKIGKRTYYPFGKPVGEGLSEEYKIKYYGAIPLIIDLPERIKKGKPILDEYESVFKAISDDIIKTPLEKVGIIKKIKGKIVEVSQNMVAKIVAQLVITANKEMEIAPGKFEEGHILDLVILDNKRQKVLLRWHLKLSEGKLVLVKSPRKIEFEVDTDFKTLARVVVGKKKTRWGEVIKYDAWDAWLNNDIEIYGATATQRAVNVIKNILLNPKVTGIVGNKFKILEKYI